jgi:hypothetical protein
VRSRDWRRTSQGLYVPSTVELTVEQRIVEAAAVLPAYGAVSGWAALRWLGGSWFDGKGAGGAVLPVTLALMDSSITSQPGIAISEERLDPTQIQRWRGLRVTSAAYALLFDIRHAHSDASALVAADMAAYDDLVSAGELAVLVARSQGWDGIERGRRVVGLMAENAWSPAEVVMRIIWTDVAGLPRPLTNQPVFDVSGRLVGTPDLLDPEAGVAGEYDSDLHLESSRRRRDLEREDAFRAVGLEPVAMVTGELGDPWKFVARLRAAYARSARIPADRRRWTIVPPDWWVVTHSVDRRRALTQNERDRWLRYRNRAA